MDKTPHLSSEENSFIHVIVKIQSPSKFFESSRTTVFDDASDPMNDEWKNKGEEDLKRWWTGKTIFKTKCVDSPEAMHAAAAKAKPGNTPEEVSS